MPSIRLALCLSLSLPLAAQDMVAVAWTGDVYALDSFTGTSTLIGSGLFGQNALARDDAGTLWSTHRTASLTYWLTVVDPQTGGTTQLFPNMPDLRGLASAGGGLLWAIQDASLDRLVLVDSLSGDVTVIGPTGFAGIQCLALIDNAMYAWDGAAGLLSIDPSTGTATAIGLPPPAGVSMQWLARRADGRLVGGHNSLYELDPATGAVTPIGTGSLPDLRGAEPLQNFVRNFGTGCQGVGGQVASTAAIGSGPAAQLTLSSTNHQASAIGAVAFGLSDRASGALPLPLSIDPVFGTQGCTLYASLDVLVAGLTSPTFPATLDVQVPILPDWPGNALFAQHAVLENVPGGVSLSDAVLVQFGF